MSTNQPGTVEGSSMGVKIDEYRRWPVPFLHCGDSGDLLGGEIQGENGKVVRDFPDNEQVTRNT